MTLQKEEISVDSLAEINKDGSMAKMLAAPVVVVLVVAVLIVLVRMFQTARERRAMRETSGE